MTDCGIEAKIISALQHGDHLTVSQLRERTGVSNGTLWYHLARLRGRGTVLRKGAVRNGEYLLAVTGKDK